MKYDVTDNFGKRAYYAMEDLKRNRGTYTSNAAKSNKTIKYKIYQTTTSINKTTIINGDSGYINVKIYNDNDNNYDNIAISIIVNGVAVYLGRYANGLNIDVPIADTATLNITMDSESEMLYDINVEITGAVIDNGCAMTISEVGDNVYVTHRGLGECIVMKYTNFSDLQQGVVADSCIIPVKLLDAKSIIDTNLFVGSTHLVLGIASNGYLVYYTSDDNYATPTTIHGAMVQTAALSNNANQLVIYYINSIASGGQLISCNMVDGEWIETVVPWVTTKNPILRTIQKCSDSVLPELIAITGRSGAIYLLGVVIGDAVITSSHLLGDYDDVSMSATSDVSYCYLSKGGRVEKKSLTFSTYDDVILSDESTHIPCSDAIYLSHGEILIYNGYLTV